VSMPYANLFAFILPIRYSGETVWNKNNSTQAGLYQCRARGYSGLRKH
jgi:hypothetical protein